MTPQPTRSSATQVLEYLLFLPSLGLVLVPFLFPPCGEALTGALAHHCGRTFFQATLLGGGVLSLCFFLLWGRRPRVRLFALAFQLILGLLIALVPSSYGSGICRRDDMACHVTAANLWVVVAVQWLLSLSLLVLELRTLARATQTTPKADPWDKSTVPVSSDPTPPSSL